MAAQEMYDYLEDKSSEVDYGAVTLAITPQRVLVEEGKKNQVVLMADDNSEERISLSDDPIFIVSLEWDYIPESDAGQIVEFYYNSAKGNGITRTFKWSHPTDGHTYVVRFNGPLSRKIYHSTLLSHHGFASLKLRVIGRIDD